MPSVLTLPLWTADSVVTTPEVDAMVSAGAPVAVGVSGGKDSSAVAFATCEYLDSVGHAGPRILVHSDLGMVEWRESLPACERLAARLGMELVVVRRKAGGLMERWETRWRNNVERYRRLQCVKMILPWSTASMRFCTSELKTDIICRELVRRWRGRAILSVTGIRAEESPNRAKAPVSKPQPKLHRRGTRGLDWNAILHWTARDVFSCLEARGFPLHPAYAVYGCSRVSCAFCILSSQADLAAAALCGQNEDLYRRMVALESASGFSFQDSKWLGDVAPHLLDPAARKASLDARRRAERRQALEQLIPEELLYVKGWPTVIPTRDAAGLLCHVRREVARPTAANRPVPGTLVCPAGGLIVTPPQGPHSIYGVAAPVAGAHPG